MAVKAAAAVAVFDTHEGCVAPEWLMELAEATLRDVLAIRGGA